jgi:hypothetical protein
LRSATWVGARSTELLLPRAENRSLVALGGEGRCEIDDLVVEG